MFKALSVQYIGIWLILTTNYVGKDYLGGTYSVSLPFSILVFIGIPFILGYFTRMESENEKTNLD